MSGTGIGGHQHPHHGKTDEWYTPPEIFQALGLAFDLDPASPLDGPVPWIPAKRFLTARENGLTAPWNGTVWLNPPYGPQTGRWLQRLAEHDDGIALVFARTDTRWFHESAPTAHRVCFLAGRPHFYDSRLQRAPYNCGAPIVLMAWGDKAADALDACKLGLVLQQQYETDIANPLLPLFDQVAS